jgi:IS30 family transposase
MGVRTITTDNGCEFCAHQDISKILGNVPIFFADSYASWQKGAIENENKLIRQYIPKETEFDNVTLLFIKKIQTKLNNRPRLKLNFSSPKIQFFKHFS